METEKGNLTRRKEVKWKSFLDSGNFKKLQVLESSGRFTELNHNPFAPGIILIGYDTQSVYTESVFRFSLSSRIII